MTRYAEIEKAAIDVANELEAELNAKYPASVREFPCMQKDFDGDMQSVIALRAALALPEDSKVVNAELYGLAVKFADDFARFQFPYWLADMGGYFLVDEYTIKHNVHIAYSLHYFQLREASGEPMPYKVVRDGDKVRFL